MTDEELFKKKEIRLTTVRRLVWKTMQQMQWAFSLSDLEDKLLSIDKSTIFRSISLFLEHDMLHEIDDGSGSKKYCLCTCADSDHHVDHVHLTCSICHRTFCLKNQQVPLVSLPEGFLVQHIEYLVKGVCAECTHHLKLDKPKLYKV